MKLQIELERGFCVSRFCRVVWSALRPGNASRIFEREGTEDGMCRVVPVAACRPHCLRDDPLVTPGAVIITVPSNRRFHAG